VRSIRSKYAADPCGRLIAALMHTRLLQPSTVRQILALAQVALFPNGKAAPAVPDPSHEEQLELKHAAEQAIEALMPGVFL
jgi:hypothetical protein